MDIGLIDSYMSVEWPTARYLLPVRRLISADVCQSESGVHVQESAPLSTDVAIPLALAYVQEISHSVGAPVLFFKGVPAQLQQLREPRPSADVDVIVHPNHMPALVVALEQRGWLARRTPPDDIRIIPNHAVTLVHESWPCDLDLQYFFPGIFAPPEQAFEVLWTHRSTLTVAGRPVNAPDSDAHRLLLAVNTMRDLGTPKADRDAAHLARHFTSRPADWERVVQLGSRLRALAILREFALEHGLPAPTSDLTKQEQRQLVHLLKYKSGAVGNLKYLLTDPAVSPGRKLHAMRLQLVKSRTQLATESSTFSGGTAAMVRKNVQRIGTAAAHLRDARRRNVRISHERSAAPSGPEFQPVSPAAPLEFAQLDSTHSGVVVRNAPPSPATAPHPAPPTGPLRVGRCAGVDHHGSRFVLALDPGFLARNPQQTPPVLQLDASGQELLELLAQPATPAQVIQQIAQRHGVDRAAITPGITDFLAQLLAAGVVEEA